MTPDGRLDILDVWVDPVNMQQALARVEEFVEDGERPHAIFAVNPEKNFSVPKNPTLYETFRNADLLIPDGIGVVLAARILYGAKLGRVPGVELMAAICALAARKKYKVFIYGAREEVNSGAATELVKRYPGLKIVGRANGYVKEEDMPALVERINASAAEILFVALGSPRQEAWYARHKDSLGTIRVCQGIGGTLDTIVGTVRRAPAFWCRWIAEWLYRLLSEPQRITRQKVLPLFAVKVFSEKFKQVLHAGGRVG
jgi:N-acetylglucosaminyldiphosphoundecaprenol N-acetyl-beta-D-mannosaminyltransferase